MTREHLVPAGLVAYGALQLVQGAWMLVSPGTFFDAIGPFGARNDHYTRDAATWSVALGAAMLVTALRAHRVPAGAAGALLLLAALQAGLHTANHVADVGAAHPGWIGVFDALSLAALTVALALLWRLEHRRTSAATAVPLPPTAGRVSA